ncbi:hypothetical protein O7632_32055, partial [Solwaraspora sp. WMMD406]|nr:hypothetical protein [Solwaraspora sp. WMMD406]
MSGQFSDWTGDDDPSADDGYGPDGHGPDGYGDADTAELNAPLDGYPSAYGDVAGFGDADDEPPAEEGFGSAYGDEVDDAGDTPGGSGGALGYGDDLSPGDGGPAGPYADTDPEAESGFGDADPVAQELGPAEVPPGADPDVPAGADEWPEADFPPPLDPAGVPTPVDGWPWADPDLLGDWSVDDVPLSGADDGADDAGAVTAAELAGYAATEAAGDDTNAWA